MPLYTSYIGPVSFSKKKENFSHAYTTRPNWYRHCIVSFCFFIHLFIFCLIDLFVSQIKIFLRKIYQRHGLRCTLHCRMGKERTEKKHQIFMWFSFAIILRWCKSKQIASVEIVKFLKRLVKGRVWAPLFLIVFVFILKINKFLPFRTYLQKSNRRRRRRKKKGKNQSGTTIAYTNTRTHTLSPLFILPLFAVFHPSSTLFGGICEGIS